MASAANVEKENAGTQTAPQYELQVENDRLKEAVGNLQNEIERKETDYIMVNLEFFEEIVNLTSQIKEKDEKLRRFQDELARLKNEKRRDIGSAQVFTESLQPLSSSQPSTFSPSTEASGGVEDRRTRGQSLERSLEGSTNTEQARSTNGIERSLYNNYKLLLFTIADRLLWSDVNKLKEWVCEKFDAKHSMNINELFRYLGEKKVIDPTDLTKLREFFETILRVDLVYLIDCFINGRYNFLAQCSDSHERSPNPQKTSSRQKQISQKKSFQSAPLSVDHTQESLNQTHQERMPFGNRVFYCDVCGIRFTSCDRVNDTCYRCARSTQRSSSHQLSCCFCHNSLGERDYDTLQCNHVVHRNCRSQLIQDGKTSCPICTS